MKIKFVNGVSFKAKLCNEVEEVDFMLDSDDIVLMTQKTYNTLTDMILKSEAEESNIYLNKIEDFALLFTAWTINGDCKADILRLLFKYKMFKFAISDTDMESAIEELISLGYIEEVVRGSNTFHISNKLEKELKEYYETI